MAWNDHKPHLNYWASGMGWNGKEKAIMTKHDEILQTCLKYFIMLLENGIMNHDSGFIIGIAQVFLQKL